ncbi:MAG: choice-of-anchor D domain-containing protein, partial [Candidatus Sulfotelmatobacter sp.]
MRLRLAVFLCCFLVVFVVGSIFLSPHVLADREIKDLPGSKNGTGAPGDCSDSSPTPFAVALNGQVTPPTCNGFTGTGAYPNYALPLVSADQSFTLTVTPVLWGGGAASDTILHLEFSSTNPNLTLQSFVIGGLTSTDSSVPALYPAYVVCSIVEGTTTQFYELEAVENSNTSASVVVCTTPTMTTGTDSDGTPELDVIQPTPINFADGATTRWDIVGLNGSNPLSSPLPSVDLFVSGVPSDLVNELNLSSPTTNNLTSAFMANANNFLAVAFNSATNQTVSAGGLDIPTVTTPLSNDSISSATTVDPTMAISPGGFTSTVNIASATPGQNPDGSFSNEPSPPDPQIPAGCFSPSSAAAPIFRTVWYSFTPIGDGTVTIDTANSRFDSVLAVYTGAAGNLMPVSGACNDNPDALHLQAKVAGVPVTHGIQYFIMVGESPTQTGLLNDNVTGLPVVPNQTVAAPLSNDATLFISVTESTTAAAAVLNPISGSTLAFGNQQVGVSSAPQKVTITSTGGTPLNISNIKVSGDSGLAISNTTCNAAVTEGTSCEIDVTWTPSAVAAMVASSLTFSDGVAGSSPAYSITGTGTSFTFPTPASTTGTLTTTN